MREHALCLILLALVVTTAQAQEAIRLESRSEIEIVELGETDACMVSVFVRGSYPHGGQLAFVTLPCSRFYPAVGASYNPWKESYEVLGGVATDVPMGRANLALFATYAYVKDAGARGVGQLEWFIGPLVPLGSCTFDAFAVGYVPLRGHGTWRNGLDHARLVCDVGTFSVGGVYDLFYVEGGPLEQRAGPAIVVETPIGPVQIDVLLNLANQKNVIRVGYGFTIPLTDD